MDSETKKPVNVDPALKQRLAGLYSHMSRRLGIKLAPKIIFTQNVNNSKKPFGLTAFYNPAERSIKVYITDRHPTDILRSFAHELIHHWQNEHKSLPPPEKNAGQDHYAQKNPTLRRREMEAYLLGNMLFRDWQDEKRYGPINENLRISNPELLQKEIKRMLIDLIKNRIIDSYHRERTSADMIPSDFIEELTRKIELGIGKFVQTMNNKGNWENGPNMIKEHITIAPVALRSLITERITEKYGKR